MESKPLEIFWGDRSWELQRRIVELRGGGAFGKRKKQRKGKTLERKTEGGKNTRERKTEGGKNTREKKQRSRPLEIFFREGNLLGYWEEAKSGMRVFLRREGRHMKEERLSGPSSWIPY